MGARARGLLEKIRTAAATACASSACDRAARVAIAAQVHDRLHRSLSVVYGIEPYIILKDIWGLPDREVERIALWMADAAIDAALREAKRPTHRRPSVAATGNGRARVRSRT